MNTTYQMMVFEDHFDDLPYPISFKPYLFNEVRHIESQKPFDKLLTFALLNESERAFDARMQVVKTKNLGFSPFKATFGGIEYAESLSQTDLFSFFQDVLLHPEVMNLNLTIREKPAFYTNSCFDWATEKVVDINQHLVVDNQLFIEKISSSERRRLRKCQRAGFVFEEMLKPDFNLVHTFIKANRDRKFRPTTMSIIALKHSFEQMPNDYKVFVVKDNQKIIALSVVVRLNGDSQYIFLPADDVNYLQFSPSVMLFAGIYEFCQKQNFKILDFGISTEAGVLNEGLFRFKKNLGCVASEKVTFRRIE